MAETPTIALPTRLAGKAKTQTVSTAYARGENLRRDDRVDPNVSVRDLRGAATASALMRLLADTDGTVSTAVIQYVAMAKTNWKINAYSTWTNEFSREGLLAAETIISGLDTLWNYTTGFQDKKSLSELIETLLLESMLTGGVGLELVMDTYKVPVQLLSVPYDSFTWKSNGRGGRYPVQKSATGEEVELNIPNLWVAELVKSASRLYTLPLMVAGVKRLVAYETFVEDMQRVLRRAGGPRLLVKLDYEKVRSAAPPETANDPEKLGAFLEQTRADLEGLLASLNPEDALVYYDLAEVDSVETSGEKKDYKELLEELSGLAASALKTNPSMMGLRMGSGSQNIASTEAMLALKMAMLFQAPVETVMSRALTLAVRLYGIDAYIKFKFEDVDLRPKAELEAHFSMRQQRVLELLSLGRITDDEAQTMLGLGSIPDTAEELSGTRFLEPQKADTLPASGTNARNASVMPGTPTSGGGKDNNQRV